MYAGGLTVGLFVGFIADCGSCFYGCVADMGVSTVGIRVRDCDVPCQRLAPQPRQNYYYYYYYYSVYYKTTQTIKDTVLLLLLLLLLLLIITIIIIITTKSIIIIIF